MCVWLKSLPSSCAGPWRGLASSGLPVEALERGLDLEGPAKGLAMEPKEEPDWEAEQVPSRNKKKSWADLAAEEKKDPPKKDAHHGQKKEWWEEDWKKVAKAGMTGGKKKRVNGKHGPKNKGGSKMVRRQK